MMKNKALVLTILMAMLLLVSIPTFAEIALPKAPSNSYVLDEGGKLSQDTITYIDGINEKLKSTGAQIGVAVVNNMAGADIESYSNALFRKWGVGDKKKNNGVLLVVALDERKVRFEVGYGLEGAINDAKTGSIIRKLISPEFRNGNFDIGVLQGVKAIVGLVQKEYNIDLDQQANAYANAANTKVSKKSDVDWIFKIIIILIIMSFFSGGRRGRGRGNVFMGGPFIGGGGFGGGGDGGGFGGFGGGDSGGGGASGDW